MVVVFYIFFHWKEAYQDTNKSVPTNTVVTQILDFLLWRYGVTLNEMLRIF